MESTVGQATGLSLPHRRATSSGEKLSSFYLPFLSSPPLFSPFSASFLTSDPVLCVLRRLEERRILERDVICVVEEEMDADVIG